MSSIALPAMAGPRAADPKACQSLQPGQYRDLLWSDLPAAVRKGSAAQYRLIRSLKTPELYRVILNFEFLFVDKVDGQDVITRRGNPDWPARQDEIARHVRECYAEINPTLIGPRGERLRLELYDSSAPDAAVRFGAPTLTASEIRVYSHAIERVDSANWSLDMQSTCETLVHESLHKAGLGDLYLETDFYLDANGELTRARTEESAPAYDCRLVGPKDSIMSDERDAYLATLGRTFRKAWVMRFAGMFNVVPDHVEPKLETAVPARKNLLYPAEFYKIIDSNPCTRGQDIYSQCLVGAYVTSVFEACPQRPDICEDPDYEWLK